MQDIYKLARIQIAFVILFVICKKVVRPFVLNRSFPDFADITVLSLPNFFEGVVGVLTLTGLGLYIFNSLKIKFQLYWVYLMAVILAAIYTITQEFKIHNLGGNNIYDPYDVLFSVIGLILGYLIVLRVRPSIQD